MSRPNRKHNVTFAAKKVSRHSKSETKLLTKISRPILSRPVHRECGRQEIVCLDLYACITVKAAISKLRFATPSMMQTVEQQSFLDVMLSCMQM